VSVGPAVGDIVGPLVGNGVGGPATQIGTEENIIVK
jgi:hypothetical protein